MKSKLRTHSRHAAFAHGGLIVVAILSLTTLRAFAQTGTSPCNDKTCKVDSLVLNTGYDPANSSLYPQSNPPSVVSQDGYWQVVSGPSITPGPAYVIPANGAWNTIPNSEWISPFDYPGFGFNNFNGMWGSAPYPINTGDPFVIERCFCVCDSDLIQLNLQMLVDNGDSIFLDGNYIATDDMAGSQSNWNSVSAFHLPPFTVNKILSITPGSHCLSIHLYNLSGVAMGFDIVGTVKSLQPPLPIFISDTCCQPFGSICGRKIWDKNCNGVDDNSSSNPNVEPGLPGWTIVLNPGNIQTTTDTNGYFCFDNLAPGTYSVSEVAQNGWQESFPAPPDTTVHVSAGQVTEIEFGNCAVASTDTCARDSLALTTDLSVTHWSVVNIINPGTCIDNPAPPYAAYQVANPNLYWNPTPLLSPPTPWITDNSSAAGGTNCDDSTVYVYRDTICAAASGSATLNLCIAADNGITDIQFNGASAVSPAALAASGAQYNCNSGTPFHTYHCFTLPVSLVAGINYLDIYEGNCSQQSGGTTAGLSLRNSSITSTSKAIGLFTNGTCCPSHATDCSQFIGSGTLDSGCCQYSFPISSGIGNVKEIEYAVTGATIDNITTSPCVPSSTNPSNLFGSTSGDLFYSPPCTQTMNVSVDATPTTASGRICITWSVITFHNIGPAGQLDTCTFTTCYTCQRMAESQCDSISAVPFDDPNNTLDWRRFTVWNTKLPASPIRKILVSLTPTPCTGSWQGGHYIGGTPYTGATNCGGKPNSSDPYYGLKKHYLPLANDWFRTPYTMVPNAVVTSLNEYHYAQFDIGVDYTCSPVWTGTVTFTVIHCDGDTCILTYGPWTASAPQQPCLGCTIIGSVPIAPSKLYAWRFRVMTPRQERPIKYLSIETANVSDAIFAGSGKTLPGQMDTAAQALDEYTQGQQSCLFTFDRPIAGEDTSGYIDIVIAHDSSVPGPPVVKWITYDTSGTPLMTDTTSFKGGTSIVGEITGLRRFSAPLDIISISPNPASGPMLVSYFNNEAAHLRLDIYNLLGKQMLSVDEGFVAAGMHSATLDVGTLAAGTYLCRLSSDSGSEMRKFVVVK